MAVTRYRRFWLENESGELVPLNGENGIHFSNPEGLGLESDVKYAGNGGGFYQRSAYEGDRQATPKGKLIFVGGNPDMQYRQLMDWIMEAGELNLVYMPGRQADMFRRRVELISVTRTERDKVGWLICPVQLAVLTPWAVDRDIETTYSRSGSDPFIVGGSIVGVDTLSRGFEHALSGTVRAEGHLPAALHMRYASAGRMSNPVITVTGNTTGRVYGRCMLWYSTSGGGTLEWSTEPHSSYIRFTPSRSGSAIDMLPYVDLNYDPFPMIPVTEPCTVRVSTGSDEMAGENMTLTVRQYRRAV